MDSITRQSLLDEINRELNDARYKFPNMHNLHEGYSVILEELDEFWEAVRMKNVPGNLPRIQQARKELIQVAAMAMRCIEDCCQ